MSAYLKGRADGLAGKQSANPFPEFSADWVLYNRGFNATWMPNEARPA